MANQQRSIVSSTVSIRMKIYHLVSAMFGSFFLLRKFYYWVLMMTGKVVTKLAKEFEATTPELVDKVILLSSLPEEIQVEIFVKLPVDSILACRCVCKDWRLLLCSQNFIKTQLKYAKPKLMLSSFHPENDNCLLRSIDYASTPSALPTSPTTICTCDCNVPKYHAFERMYFFIQMLGSCNGLICMALNQWKDICIWNPSTGECRITPLPSSDFFTGEPLCDPGHVFYYDCVTDDYKLVKIAENIRSGGYQVDVYALGSKSWSLVKTVKSMNHYMFPDHKRDIFASLVNGAINWIGFKNITGVSSMVIVSFNVRSESFVDIFFPKEVQQLTSKTYTVHDCTVGEFEDSLCFCIYHEHLHRMDVWLMGKYGVRESWTKRFSISTTNISLGQPQWKLLWYFANGELLIDIRSNKMLYDPKNNRLRALTIPSLDYVVRFSAPMNYVESLVSPNYIGY